MSFYETFKNRKSLKSVPKVPNIAVRRGIKKKEKKKFNNYSHHTLELLLEDKVLILHTSLTLQQRK